MLLCSSLCCYAGISQELSNHHATVAKSHHTHHVTIPPSHHTIIPSQLHNITPTLHYPPSHHTIIPPHLYHTISHHITPLSAITSHHNSTTTTSHHITSHHITTLTSAKITQTPRAIPEQRGVCGLHQVLHEGGKGSRLHHDVAQVGSVAYAMEHKENGKVSLVQSYFRDFSERLRKD
jgi:hypothetical protein